MLYYHVQITSGSFGAAWRKARSPFAFSERGTWSLYEDLRCRDGLWGFIRSDIYERPHLCSDCHVRHSTLKCIPSSFFELVKCLK